MLDGERVVLATAALKGTGFISEVKKREDAVVFELTAENRDSLAGKLTEEIRAALLESWIARIFNVLVP